MKFSQIVSALAVAVTVSGATLVTRNSGGLGCCSSDKEHYTLCESPSTQCPSGQGFFCYTTGVVNLLNCVNVLSGDSVSVPITISPSVPITL